MHLNPFELFSHNLLQLPACELRTEIKNELKTISN